MSHLTKIPKVTILTPVYNEEAGLPFYVERVREVLLSRRDCEYRVLFIDDGSTDTSWPLLRKICCGDSRFEAIRLSRNFGSHVALSAGIDSACGDAVAVLACDLQDPPEVIVEFAEKWQRGAKIVWGKRRTREDIGWRVVASKFFFWLLKRYAMPKGSMFTTGSFLLADRKVVQAFKSFSEHNRITFALMAWTGFDQDVVEYDRKRRINGKSGWDFGRMIKTMYDALIGFSQAPIKLITLIGGVIFILSILVASYVFFNWLLFGGETIPGWSSLMLMVSGFFGIQFLLTGIMGEYLSRIYTEATRRPLYFISENTHESALFGGNGEKPGASSIGAESRK